MSKFQKDDPNDWSPIVYVTSVLKSKSISSRLNAWEYFKEEYALLVWGNYFVSINSDTNSYDLYQKVPKTSREGMK